MVSWSSGGQLGSPGGRGRLGCRGISARPGFLPVVMAS